jgi:hypothetical protein
MHSSAKPHFFAACIAPHGYLSGAAISPRVCIRPTLRPNGSSPACTGEGDFLSLRHCASWRTSVVHPGNHLHDHGKGQQAQKRHGKTVHRCLSPPCSREKVNPSKERAAVTINPVPHATILNGCPVTNCPNTSATATKFPKSIIDFANNSRGFCCIGCDWGEVLFSIYPSNHIYIIKSNVYRRWECCCIREPSIRI